MKALIPGMLMLCSISRAQETIHIHTDKQIYLPGETIWFKAYLFSNGQPSPSTNLYSGLYDAAGNLITEKRFPVIEGTANGDFLINDSVSTEALQLYLFTKTMARDSNGFTHVVRLLNGRNKVIRYATPQPELMAIAEGGNLIAGLVNKLIIRGSNPDNKISGSLNVTGSRQFIDSFYLDEDGFAELQFIPNASHRYYISWSGKHLKEQEILLAPPQPAGATLRAAIAGNMLHYSLQKNSNADRFQTLHLSLFSGEEFLYRESITINRNNNFTGSFKTDSLPPVVLHLVLTDDKANKLQQKKISNLKEDVNINVITKNLGPKGKNVIDITVADTSMHSMSISITDPGFEAGSSSSIYELLTPGAHAGNIHRNLSRKNLELLLNTTTINIPLKPGIAEDNYLSLYISTKERKYSVPEKSTLDLIISDKGFGKQFHNLNPSSATGYMKSGLIFYDSARVYYKVDNNKSLDNWLIAYVDDKITVPAKILPLSLQEQGIKNEISYPDTVISEYARRQSRFNDVQVLKTVVVKGKTANPVTKRLQEIDEKYSTGTFRGITRGYQLNALDDPDAERSIDIFSYLTYRIPGIQTAGTLGSRYIKNNSFRDGEPVLFINETESPRESLETISPSQLAYVKFIPGIVVGSAGYTANGALYVYTKRGDEPGAIPNMKSEVLKGYDMSRDFQSPDHSGMNNNNITDYRTTLYWNPYLYTDRNNRKIQITYFNNDLAKKHLVILKGTSAEGKLIEIKKIIE